MAKWAYRMHFEDLMTRVNALVSKAETDVGGQNTDVKQGVIIAEEATLKLNNKL